MGMSAYRTCTAHTLLQKRLPWYHRSCLTQSLNTYLLCCAFLQQLCQCPHDGPHTVSIQTTAQQLQQHLNATQLHKGTAPARTSSSTRRDLLCSLRSTSSGHSTARQGVWSMTAEPRQSEGLHAERELILSCKPAAATTPPNHTVQTETVLLSLPAHTAAQPYL